jgi:hypothetical protein
MAMLSDHFAGNQQGFASGQGLVGVTEAPAEILCQDTDRHQK